MTGTESRAMEMERTSEEVCKLLQFALIAIVALVKLYPDSHHSLTNIAAYESTKCEE